MDKFKFTSQKVAVVGAGLGGLSAAIRLAKQGFDVSIFEKNSTVGGKMNQFSANGYTFDTGPSVLTMPEVLDDLFKFCEKKRSDYFDLLPLEPLCRYFWDDGSRLDASKNLEKMTAEMAYFSTADAANYSDFLAYAAEIYDITTDIFLKTPVHELPILLQRLDLATLLRFPKIDPLNTLHKSIQKRFSDPRLQQLFGRFATYNGSNPYKAPATLNVITHVEHGMGSYYVKGGMYKIVDTLLKLAMDFGVKLHLDSPVDQILHENGNVSGVSVNKSVFLADYVICNADVIDASAQLISGFPKRQKKLEKLEPSLSGMVFMWGVNKSHSQLDHHNIFFSGNYKREFQHIFDDKTAPDDPTIYVAITSKNDPQHAPSNAENWFVLLNMPYLSEGQNWDVLKNKMRKAVFQKLKKHGIDIQNNIEVEKTYTPEDFHKLYRSNRGSIYGVSSNSPLTAFRRPPNRSRDICGLYFAGGSSHPGGGIPLVLLSGQICADLISRKVKTGNNMTAVNALEI